jgi:poly-gamma-glutamate capsule biosynthesis protein CapA/YwtB (metallophosphatase superfamily)
MEIPGNKRGVQMMKRGALPMKGLFWRLSFLLLGLVLLLSALAHGLPAQSSAPDADFRIALTGDSMIETRISVYDAPAFLAMINRIRSADVAFTNFENLVGNYESFTGSGGGGGPAGPTFGTYMQADPFVLDELKWAGLRIFSHANNHSDDYGTEGLLTSMRYFRKAGMVFAGAGENLELARAPGYFDTKKGRVALIACASSYPASGIAGEDRPDVKGRPGISPLRSKTTYTVEPATLASLRRLGGAGETAGQGNLRLFGATFRAGDTPGVMTEPDAKDMEGILRGVRDARRMADWVIVSIHAHQSAPGNVELPADFLRTFAHAAIDAGADVFVGHGPHMLRGIEIYNGKPIFYSLGNFIMQDDLVKYEPQDAYDIFNLPVSATPADFYDARWKANSMHFRGDKRYWQSVIAEPAFNSEHKLQAVDLYPIALTYSDTNRVERGQPWPANPEEAGAIIEHLAGLSMPMGTKITFQDGKGVVRLDSESK